jgi:streptomycin 6-kinase
VRSIDFTKSTVTIEQQWTRGAGGVMVSQRPKTRAGRRTIASPNWLMDMLADHLVERGISRTTVRPTSSSGPAVRRSTTPTGGVGSGSRPPRLALRLWASRGAVLLYAAEDLGHTLALLVERCNPGVPLSGLPEPDQDRVIARLLGQLWLEPPTNHSFRPLEEMCKQWAAEFETKTAGRKPPVDPGLVRTAMELFRHLPPTSARTVLISTDLHAGNVLAAEREPWLATDPKPYVGEPTYDVLQHMLNCPARLKSDPINLINRVAYLAGLQTERTRLWLFARCVQESPDWPGLAEVAYLITPP